VSLKPVAHPPGTSPAQAPTDLRQNGTLANIGRRVRHRSRRIAGAGGLRERCSCSDGRTKAAHPAPRAALCATTARWRYGLADFLAGDPGRRPSCEPGTRRAPGPPFDPRARTRRRAARVPAEAFEPGDVPSGQIDKPATDSTGSCSQPRIRRPSSGYAARSVARNAATRRSLVRPAARMIQPETETGSQPRSLAIAHARRRFRSIVPSISPTSTNSVLSSITSNARRPGCHASRSMTPRSPHCENETSGTTCHSGASLRSV
jgi:hypothetical protein